MWGKGVVLVCVWVVCVCVCGGGALCDYQAPRFKIERPVEPSSSCGDELASTRRKKKRFIIFSVVKHLL